MQCWNILQKHGWISKAVCSIKETRHKKLYNIQFQLQCISEKERLIGIEIRYEVVETDTKVHKETLGDNGNVLHLNCVGGYMILYVHLTVRLKGVNFIICEL